MTKPETKRALAIVFGVTVLLGSSLSGFAVAEGATEGVIEEIMVTATKRQADEFDVPIAMEQWDCGFGGSTIALAKSVRIGSNVMAATLYPGCWQH